MAGERLGECGGVGDDLLGVGLNDGSSTSPKATALAAMACSSWPPCRPGNMALSMAAACSARLRMQPPPQAPERLVRGEGHDVDIRHRIGMHATGDQTGNVRGVEHEQGTDLIGDLTERRRIDDAR